jgi:hypothetical protein
MLFLTFHYENNFKIKSEISSSHSGEYEHRAFWDIVPCSLVVVDRSPDDGGSIHL